MTGFWYGVSAYIIWGLFPIYWKLVQHVPALQVLGHRIVWAFILLVVIAAFRRRSSAAWRIPPGVFGLYALAALFIAINSFLYVYAVNAGFIVETSLGYFITPLVNVMLGVVVLRERLRALQWVAVLLAAAGVLYLTIGYGSLPWIACGLALSFGSYGLVKKKAPLDAMQGMTLETGIAVIPAAAYLLALHADGTGAFLRTGAVSDLVLVGSGLVTVSPLLLFASAVQRVPLSVIGLLQYIAPTIQFLLGVFLYREPFSRTQLVGFAAVWTAIAVFSADSLRARRGIGTFVSVDTA
jgi:chloramphenicol-sensitive protein RarD